MPLGPGLPAGPPDFSSREERLKRLGLDNPPAGVRPWLCHGGRCLLVRDDPWPFEKILCPRCGKTTQPISWTQYRFEKSFGRLGFRQSLTSSTGPVVCSTCRGKTTKKMLQISGGLCASCWRIKKAPMRDVQKRIRKVKHALALRDQ